MTILKQALSNFFVQKIRIENIDIQDNEICILFLINDTQKNTLRFCYDTISFNSPQLHINDDTLKTFGAAVAILACGRFGAVLPKELDISKYADWVHPELLDFFQKTLPFKWSEHRYQAGSLAYFGPNILYDESRLGTKAVFPIWGLDKPDAKVVVASGSGKDSLLCMRLIEEANIRYDQFTYLYDLYGNVEEQDGIFNRLSSKVNYENRHVIKMYDDFFPWLDKRLEAFEVKKKMKKYGMDKPFRTEAGEVFTGALLLMPIQVVHNISLQVFGNEKSSDFANIIDDETGQRITHQYDKNFYAEKAVFRLFSKMFNNINRISLTKPIHDVKIFKTLFRIADDLPYLTNSCNFQKPWCGKCEKCLYVFAGFAAFGDYAKTIAAFGLNPMENEHNTYVWKDLLGLFNRVAWECVGHPEETQLYFYKLYQKGINNLAMTIFKTEVLAHLENPKAYFEEIESRYSVVYDKHHHMPDWLWEKINLVLQAPELSIP